MSEWPEMAELLEKAGFSMHLLKRETDVVELVSILMELEGDLKEWVSLVGKELDRLSQTGRAT